MGRGVLSEFVNHEDVSGPSAPAGIAIPIAALQEGWAASDFQAVLARRSRLTHACRGLAPLA